MKLPNDRSWNTDNVVIICLVILVILTIGDPDILDGIIGLLNPCICGG